MNIEKAKRKRKLVDLDCGTLFEYNGSLILKSEYRNTNGNCECFIVGTGEMFWGEGNDTKINQLLVTPIKITTS